MSPEGVSNVLSAVDWVGSRVRAAVERFRAGRQRPAEGVPGLQQLFRRLHPRGSRHGGVRARSGRGRRAHHRVAIGYRQRRHRARGRADRHRPLQRHGLQVTRHFAERRHRRHATAAARDGDHHRPAELSRERRRQRRFDGRSRADSAARARPVPPRTGGTSG